MGRASYTQNMTYIPNQNVHEVTRKREAQVGVAQEVRTKGQRAGP